MSRLETVGRERGVYFTADELMNMSFPEPRWAVPDLIAEGLNLLVGAPKLGKSWLCLDLAIAVASGGCALGKVEVEQGDVLYAALEDPPRRLRGRLEKMLHGDRVPPRLAFVTLLDRGQTAVDLVEEWLDGKPEARLVIVDVLRKVTPRGDGRNAYEVDYEAMGALKALADRHQVAIIVVHHTRKMADEGDVFNEVSGSTGLTGAADAILLAKRSRNTAEAVLHVTGRDIIEQDHGLSWDADTCKWSLLDEPVAHLTMGDTRKKIVHYVEANPGSTPKEIAAGTGVSESTVRVNVRRMVDDDQLDSTGDGRYLPPHVAVTPVTGVTHPQGEGYSSNSSYTPPVTPLHLIDEEGDR